MRYDRILSTLGRSWDYEEHRAFERGYRGFPPPDGESDLYNLGISARADLRVRLAAGGAFHYLRGVRDIARTDEEKAMLSLCDAGRVEVREHGFHGETVYLDGVLCARVGECATVICGDEGHEDVVGDLATALRIAQGSA